MQVLAFNSASAAALDKSNDKQNQKLITSTINERIYN
jgi:hypothetical protein